ncbi:MAG TPA: calcium-binding protein [Solirubrobacterales bacterium]
MFRSSKLAALLVAAAAIALLAFPVMASATATPDVQGNVLTVTSDAADQIILSVVEVEGVRQIALNGEATGLAAGPDAEIVVNAGAEDDVVDASALVAADYGALTINGEAGLDILTGGGGNDLINGGDDVDELRGGDGNDTLTAGKGDELVVLGEGGDDTMIWNAAEGSDRNDGGEGIDTVLSNGAPAAETYTYEQITEGDPAVDRVLFQRTAGAPAFSINFTAERLEVNARGGDDNLSPVGPGLGALSIIVNAGEGNDTVTTAEGPDFLNGELGNDVLKGGDGIDELRGGDDNDTLTAGKGNELVVLGENGDDTMVWNPAEGNDRNDGGEGIDTVLSNGAAAAETYTYERIAEGDPAVDRVLFQRTAGAPAFSINFTAERLEVNLLAGDDTIAPIGTGLAGLSLIANAGEGNDTVTGAEGIDELRGGDGNDRLTGGKGNELVVFGENGDDTMVWNPAEGDDRNDGGEGIDTVLSIGAAASETYTYERITEGDPPADRVLFKRTAGAPEFSINFTAERLEVNLLAGNDTIAPVGTGLGGLSLIANAGDGNDQVTGAEGRDTLNGDAGNDSLVGGKGDDTANGGDNDDTMTWNNGDGSDINNGGLGNDTAVSNGNAADEVYTYEASAQAGRVVFKRAANAAGIGAFQIDLEAESLLVNSLAGNDTFSPVGTGIAGRTTITVNAGEGNDTVTGGDGVDIQNGEAGNDTLTGGPGIDTADGGDGGDTMVWNNGDGSDTDTGGLGNDTVRSNGNNNAETYTYEAGAQPGRVLFKRTSAVAFQIDLEAESLEINSLAGIDTFNPVGTGIAGRTTITVNAGDGDDVVNGGDGVDIQNGDAGNDQLVGGKGEDVANGGDGDDTMTWNNGDASDKNTGGVGNDTVISNGNDAGDETYTYEAGDPGRVLLKRTSAGAFSIDLEAESLVVNGLGGADSFSPANADPIAGRTVLTVNGGAGADLITGADGDDTLNGGDDVDELRGGDGNDRLTGGKGDEIVISGDAGNDTMVWNPAEGNDRNDGGEGSDTVLSIGAAVEETYAYERITEGDPAVDRVLFQRTAGAPAFSINFTAERLEVNLLGGNDTIAPVGTGLGGLSLIANAGDGNDQVTGAQGADLLNGDAGNDSLVGGNGGDTVSGGDGDDTMTWNPGDGSDVNNGEAGLDTVVSNGVEGNEVYDYAPGAPGRALFRRTSAPEFSIDFDAESLVVNGKGGNDQFAPAAAGLNTVEITINAGAGNDAVTGADADDTLNGEAGNDTLIGGKGGDTVSGGDDDDTMIWNPGHGSDVNDGDAGIDTVQSNGVAGDEVYTYGAANGRVLFQRTTAPAFSIDFTAEKLEVNGEAGNDQFSPAGPGLQALAITINAGEGNDTVAGADGKDTLNGDGGKDRLAGGKDADVHSGGAGDDVIVWNNGDGTDTANGGVGSDTFESNGSSASADLNTLSVVNGELVFARTNLVPFTVTLKNNAGEATGGFENVTNNPDAGDDEFTVAAGVGVSVSANGGAGNDELTGGDEEDTFLGGEGNDVLTGGAGNDILGGQDGDDQLFARDEVADFVRGDAGIDSAQVDAAPIDGVTGVENIDAPAPPEEPEEPKPEPEQPKPQPDQPKPQPEQPKPAAPAADTKATAVTLGATKVAKVGKKLFAQLPLSCPATEAGGCQVSITLQTAKAVKLGTVKAVVVLGSAKATLAAGATATAKVALKSSASALTKGGKLAATALITSTDAAGNTVNTTAPVALKVPQPKK